MLVPRPHATRWTPPAALPDVTTMTCLQLRAELSNRGVGTTTTLTKQAELQDMVRNARR